MTLCKFYQQGYCKFGDGCKFEHPGKQAFQNQNRYGVLSNQPNYRNPPVRDSYRPGPRPSGNTRYVGLDFDTIKTDLTIDRPTWPFSAYGPGRDAPKQLLEGAVEQSFEEVRLQYYLAKQRGNEQSAQHVERQEFQKVQAQIQKILSDPDGAIRYVLSGENEHPNRIDLCKSNPNQQQSQPQARTPFGSAPTGPTALTQPRAGFGAPSFGQPSTPQNTFGKPSFGQPTAFGNPSPLGQNTAFGQPSPLAHAQTFGRPSAPTSASPFGQPAFGNPSTPTQPSSFGQPSFPSSNSPFAQKPAFGQPSAPAQPGGFGQPAFGTPPSTFGQPSNLGQPGPFAGTVASNTPFGQSAAAAVSPFGAQAPQTTSSPFGKPVQPAGPSPFSTQAAPASSSPFAKLTTTGFTDEPDSMSTSPFASPSQNQTVAAQSGQPLTGAIVSTPFGQPPSSQPQQPNGSLTNGAAPSNLAASGKTANITRDARTNAVTSFNGHPVRYIENIPYYLRNPSDPKSLERIWFPDGPPKPNPYTEANPKAYSSAISDAYEFALANGEFRDGIMPEIPPTWHMNSWAL